jgi:hypothetical protein
MTGMKQPRLQAVSDFLMSLRTCRFEHPAIRRRLKILRYTTMVISMTLFAVSLALMLLIRTQAVAQALVSGGNPDAASSNVLTTLLPIVIAVLAGALVLSEVIYNAVRSVLLRGLKKS